MTGSLKELFDRIRDYEPALAEDIERRVVETDGVMTGERQEVHGFPDWESFLKHLTWCVHISREADERERGVTLAFGNSSFEYTPGLVSKARRFIELVRKDPKPTEHSSCGST